MNLHNLNWRYATKMFDNTKKVNEHDLNELLEALRLTPSSFGLEPWKFIVVEDEELKEKLKAQAWGQAQVTDCSHLIILCARTDVDEKFISKFIEANTPPITIQSSKTISSAKMLPATKALRSFTCFAFTSA